MRLLDILTGTVITAFLYTYIYMTAIKRIVTRQSLKITK